MTAIKLNAALRLTADANEAGRALTAIKKVLGPHFLTDQGSNEQRIIWRTPKFQATLDLTLDESDMLLFSFRTKGFAAGFDAEGHTVDELLAAIRSEVTEYQPKGKVPDDIAYLRKKFATIK